ncbi:MAG TPA: LysE family transporter [Devosia sp.]|jgi:threonine/homoserine/homoserine lactone efflux protein|uniref:LysE family translocator n=1 Tax=Devosia sp. TaxID=1871048 RepID=UPI002DDD343B|nr:LysE family transporter [Devosia sp.]HEV2518720.1 LysE family transporter [Devosia sp.]
MTDPFLFIAAVLVLLGTPGPTNTLLATSGATAGVRRSVRLLVGELAGYLIAVGTIRIVLGPVIHSYALVGVALKAAVVAYLIWTAIKLWRHNAGLTQSQASIGMQAVFVTTLLNPKALIFSLSIIPTNHAQFAWYVLGFALLVPLVGFAWIVVGRAIGAAAGDRHTVVRKVASVALVGFAGAIAASVLG